MAASISNMLIPLSKTQHHEASFPSTYTKFSVLPLSLTQKSLATSKPTTICKAFPEINSSSPSIITDLEREEQEQEKLYPKTHEADQQVAEVWREIHGENDWAGLLDPMDPILRSELIRYGDMAQACYDAFDFDPYSKDCGGCRFTHPELFDCLGMIHLGYQVTRYLYATANVNLPNFFKKSRRPNKMWSKNANWIGYVAVSDDATSKRLGRRDITVAWRGTVNHLEWVADLMSFLIPVSSRNIPCPDHTVRVESGFLELYTDKEDTCRYCKYSAREQFLTELKRLVEIYTNEELSVTITGHSLGSALAILSAYDVVEVGLNVRNDSQVVPVSVISFSGPRVGNVRFKERLESLGVKVLRVVNVHDVVPRLPGLFFSEQVPHVLMKLASGLPWSYSHVGVELELDHKISPFLNPDADSVSAHNLEALLHLLDGYHGRGHRFMLATGRDPALVNKACDFLKDHYLVPPNWRQDENKGLIKNKDGRWVQRDKRPKLEAYPEDMHHHLTQLGLASSDI